MVWAIISIERKGPLVFVKKNWNKKGTLNSEGYIQHILPHVLAHQQSLKKELIFIEDNSRVHSSKATMAAEAALSIRRMWWPANSLDLNPIENVWQLIKYRLAQRYPKTKAQVR